VLHVCHVIHGLGPGGAEHLLVELGRAAGEAGLRLSVVSLVDVAGPSHTEALRSLGVDVWSLGGATRWDPRAVPRLAGLVRNLRPDVLHTHMKHADLVGAVAAVRYRVPLVSTLHVIEDAPDLTGRVKRRLAAQARTRVAARTIAVSEAQRRWYVETFRADPRRVVTVPNGVAAAPEPDPAARARLREVLDVPPGAVMVLMVAVMRLAKGHEDLLWALALLPQACPVVAVLAGDGPERRRLEKIAAGDPRIGRRLRFVGHRDDVPALLHAADLVVQPSHSDALPTALIHALAAGVPVVAAAVGGIPEIVGDGAGALVPPRDPARLASALTALASDHRRRAEMAHAARRRFAARFDARIWAARLADLYAEVLQEARV
jgi:glycosyltransferase involved in cell wall biosynthesis